MFLCFYCCLLKIIAIAKIKATANIVNAITALKSMYIIVIKCFSIISTTSNRMLVATTFLLLLKFHLRLYIKRFYLSIISRTFFRFYCSINLYFNPVFLFLISVFCIIKSIIFLLLITINNFFALVIPVYNKFLVSNIGELCGIHIITTSNSLPL